MASECAALDLPWVAVELEPPMFMMLEYPPFMKVVALVIVGNTVCIVDDLIVPAFVSAVTNPVVPFTDGPNPIEPTV